ncbi:EF-hand domain-containing protein [Nonomuraea sp. NPDC050022]|uniref:EF-hand domain-containing protein n=1 Tax=unclassified Nonomuraea TaxID=2593643 RepID=UPI0033C77A3D
MTDLLERKLRHFFGLMDRDGSDTLELDDYLAAADGVSASCGLAPGSPEHEAVRATFRRFWEDVIEPMDADGDGHVSFAEYVDGFTEGVLDESDGYERIRPLLDALIDIADADGDGRITGEEFARSLTHGFGVPADESAEAFALLDEEAKGHLTREELQRASTEYFLGTDPDAAANALFGRF